MKGFENLERACGGKITPETLREFAETTLAEYTRFMEGLGVLLHRPEEVTLH